jgi:hypothetical protein
VNFNYNNIEDVVQGLRKEIYGYNYLIDKDKFELLMKNLKQYSPELILSDDWVFVKPLVERLCSFSHVKVAPLSTFQIYNRVNKFSEIFPTTLSTITRPIASFSGFVSEVEKDTSFKGIPKYYYIYTFDQKDLKLVKYVTHTTQNIVIDTAC